MPDLPKVAFIAHPTELPFFRMYMNFLRPDKVWRDELLLKLFEWTPSYKVKEWSNVSLDGEQNFNAIMIMVPFLPEMREMRMVAIIEKIEQAIALAAKEGCSVVSMGAFTSIMIQGKEEQLSNKYSIKITSGNTLTAAIIIQSICNLAPKLKKPLSEVTLGIVGASGDIGSGCMAWFSTKVKRMIVSARGKDALQKAVDRTVPKNSCECTVTLDNFAVTKEADITIVATSAYNYLFSDTDFKPDSIICDASAPPNVKIEHAERPSCFVYHGGIARLPVSFNPGFAIGLADDFDFYGCQIEGLFIALDTTLPCSWGRGNITQEKINQFLTKLNYYSNIDVAYSIGDKTCAM